MLFGRTGDLYLDHPSFFPILEAAAELRVPLYQHPQTAPSQVRETYYQGLGPHIDRTLGTGGIGWPYDPGVQALRLILAGVFDKLPDLQIILGHWGEVVLFYLDRIDLISSALKLPRPISAYFNTNLYVTPGASTASATFNGPSRSWALIASSSRRTIPSISPNTAKHDAFRKLRTSPVPIGKRSRSINGSVYARAFADSDELEDHHDRRFYGRAGCGITRQ
jgi:hypothetical protein